MNTMPFYLINGNTETLRTKIGINDTKVIDKEESDSNKNNKNDT